MFLIHKDGTIWDPDLDLLLEITGVIDRQSEAIRVEWQDANEFRETDYFERSEHITGLGFGACQTYMVATYGFLNFPKSVALRTGPEHGGRPSVAIINAAANYWKHHDEWHLEKRPDRQAKIGDAFGAVGYAIDAEYPLSGILAELSSPHVASFVGIVQILESWRESLRQLRTRVPGT
jgi:hypothetical protein